MKKTRLAVVHSVIALLLCVSMLAGTTFAWFTDQETSANNIIKAGDLEISMYWNKDLTGNWISIDDENKIFDYDKWEPGYTEIRYVKIANEGDLAFKYAMSILPLGAVGILANVIDVYYIENPTQAISGRDDLRTRMPIGTLAQVIAGEFKTTGEMEKGEELVVGIALKMQEDAGNQYMGKSVGDSFSIQLVATQLANEDDAFDNTYDENAGGITPPINQGAAANVTLDADNKVSSTTNIQGSGIKAEIPAGVQANAGVTELNLAVSDVDQSAANITLEENEVAKSVDVHITGVSEDNTTPIAISIEELLPVGLNSGNFKIYHVEDGNTVEMTCVDTLTAHNQFTYDPATGDVTLYMATFSEVAVVADTTAAWEGNFDYSWYEGKTSPYYIANADQLAAFGAIVGGMNGQTQDSFAGKTVKLVADINLGDNEEENNTNIIFYPIGYYNSKNSYKKESGGSVSSSVHSFEGTFDGNGHTIANFYQNTWEMFGDYNSGYSGTPNHYKDAMGLFGYVLNGTVKNLTVSNFSSDGEYTPTGVIAAYADGNSTFENIAIINCNPRVYNTGNGGIIGIAGDTSVANDDYISLKNITVDNSNKISALWGSYDVACGGLVGMYRGNVDGSGNATGDKISFENCHVSAIIDVYNDVCANYQYYAYRYSGMIIGSVRHNTTNAEGKTIPNMEGISATGCTVNYGDWNDYYYCEFEKNTMASYSEDYQFSRVPHSELNFTDSNGNGVVDANERASVTGCKHTHTAEENHQAIYLPFHQLFTGYSWGVSSIGLKEYSGIVTDLDITEGEQQESVVKFNSIAKDSYTTGTTVTIGELFSAIENDGVPMDVDNVQVTVSPVGDSSTAGAKYDANTVDWTQGTLTFSGVGEATITITDYYFCTPTTINVTINDREPVEKFDIVMNNGDFLHRVGNSGTVALDKLFKAKDGVTVGTVSVTVEAVGGTGASGNYSNNAIQFNGTGVVKVTITDNDYCTPTELYLEVVDAVNATSATNATSNNVVLLNNISASSLNVLDGYAFYGNGFKVNFSGDGSYRSAAVSYGFVTVSNGGILDNVQVICKIFPESYLYTSEMKAGSDGRYPYGYSAVVVSGDSTISNSYIYGARNNIHVQEGNVTIKNTVTECGSLSNVHILSNSSYTVTLENVTTIQYQTTSEFDSSKKVLGFGILVGNNESESNASIVLKGDLRQYNWVTSSDTSVSNSYAKTAISEALKVDSYQHKMNAVDSVNMGIAYLNSKTANISDSRINKNDIQYGLNEITMLTYTGQVYSILSSSEITSDSRYDATTDGVLPYEPTTNMSVMPSITHKDVDGTSLTIETANVGWITTFFANLDEVNGGSYAFNFTDLTVSKYGEPLEFTVKDSDGKTVNINTPITLNQLSTNNYTLIVTDNVKYNAGGTLVNESEIREIPFVLKASKTSIEPPKFTNAGTATAIRLVDKEGGDWRPAYTVLTGVTVTYWSASEGKVKMVDLSTLYNSGTISSNVWTYTCDDYTLTITGGQVHSDGTKITPVVSNNTLYFASTNKAFTTGTTSRSIILTYVFTDKNASTTWNRTETATYSNLSEYDYSKFKDGTLEAPSSGSGCVTPDTLVTLADGTQVRVDSLVAGDELLVWNMEIGMLDSAPIMFNDSESEAEYEVVHLYFSDGTDVKVVFEHGFWDYDLNKYVYIDENAADYIGHTFAKQNGNELAKVQLVDVVIETEVTTAWSPVTVGHLCYFVNGMLSMPGGVGGLFNIFDVDAETMTYDFDAMTEDIEKYGLYTYEELNAICPLSENMFNAAGGAYLKVSIGKGNLTINELINMITRYSVYFD